MCGICGLYNFSKSNGIDLSLINRMTSEMSHRGPDDEGFHYDDNIAMGFRRLSIIDLFLGSQPMTDSTNNLTIIFNGEIYNYLELKKELLNAGFTFRTNSDTEVLLYGYKHWGKNVLFHLKGMFAFAIWDKSDNILFIARDRFGIKPLYFYSDNNNFIFSSEIKPILKILKHKPDVDIYALHQFLKYRYVPAPNTLFENIKKLPSGSYILVTNKGFTITKWHEFRPKHNVIINSYSLNSYFEKLFELYNDSVARHLISDVPLGLLLSGGLDSSLLLYLMKTLGHKFPTFTAGFTDYFKNDEINMAKSFSSSMGMLNFSVSLSQSEFMDTLPHVIEILEEPITSSSIVPMFYLCKEASKHVKVALMGQGPDELFCGYNRHLAIHYSRYFKMFSYLPDLLKTSFSNNFIKSETKRRGMYFIGNGSKLERYSRAFSLITESFLDSLFINNLILHENKYSLDLIWGEYKDAIAKADDLTGFQILELGSSLPDELLLYADKLSMHNGLEIRVPYLDNDILEFFYIISASLKIKFFKGKYIHKKICTYHLPKEITSRKKIGFATPVGEWLMDKNLKLFSDVIEDRSAPIYSYLSYKMVNNMLKEHQNHKSDYGKILFSIFIFNVWLNRFM